ncbi:putative ubiquinone biosynthesis monooxygenase [Coemansia javaensis]|uniref:Ubiquinone biosynthesis monooxygenase n=1 Tax=Coemansia javaensis TaxID=2761396 RepID=A0A9W8H3G5_9FUNG|nr:putative ubiquinone biosynthesis monooxygenase [Coemansia javaensis]
MAATLRIVRRCIPNGGRRYTAAACPPETYDVVIVGGGPAGCALAAALGARRSTLAGRRIALVDAGKLDEARRWEPPADTAYLAGLGLWDWCYGDRIQAYDRAVATDALGGGAIELAGAAGAGTAYMVETKNLVGGLLRALDSERRVDVLERARVAGIERSGHGWPVVALADGRRLQARLVVGADGASSRVRSHAGIGVYGSEYAQYGLVATLCLDRLNATAFQRFLPTGPVALLPFPGGFANLVWSLDADHFQLLRAAPDGAFAALVNAAFRLAPAELDCLYAMLRAGADGPALEAETACRLAAFAASAAARSARLPPHVAAAAPRSRTSFPLRMRMVDSLAGDRIALVGDAGHVVHPLAGQGLNMGLEDVRCLADVLALAAAGGEDLGAPAVLARYNRQRYARNLALQGLVDKVWRVFRARAGPVAALRSAAMDGLDALPAVKRRLVSALMD